MKQFCVYLILFFSVTKSENNFFLPLLQQFSKIAEEVEGRPLPLPSWTSGSNKNPPLEKESFGNPQVESSSGTVTGTTYEESHAFYSVPYGQAPIKNLRYKQNTSSLSKSEVVCSVLVIPLQHRS